MTADPSIHELVSLAGQGAIVTGAGRGIGAAVALRLGEAGATVGVLDRDPDLVADTVEQLGKLEATAVPLVADVTEAEAVAAAVTTFLDRSTIDILVNNAGLLGEMESIREMSERQWDTVMAVNLKSQFLTIRACVPHMPRGSAIVNISSIGATHPIEQMTHYCASKGAVEAFTRALALELSPDHIRVNAIRPGGTLTPGTEALGNDPHWGTMRVERCDEGIRYLAGRHADPDDIARVVLFAASGLARFLNGQVITVDSGFSVT